MSCLNIFTLLSHFNFVRTHHFNTFINLNSRIFKKLLQPVWRTLVKLNNWNWEAAAETGKYLHKHRALAQERRERLGKVQSSPLEKKFEKMALCILVRSSKRKTFSCIQPLQSSGSPPGSTLVTEYNSGHRHTFGTKCHFW